MVPKANMMSDAQLPGKRRRQRQKPRWKDLSVVKKGCGKCGDVMSKT